MLDGMTETPEKSPSEPPERPDRHERDDGLTSNEHTYHWLALSWGTEAFLLKEDYHDKSRKDLMVYTDKVLKDAGKVADGDKIVILSSAQGDHQPGRTDSIYVHTVGACD